MIQRPSHGAGTRQRFPAGLIAKLRWLGDLLVARPPGLARLMKLQPLTALFSSAVVLVLFDRGFEKIPLIIVLAIFSFAYITFRIYRLQEQRGGLTALWDTALIYALGAVLLFVLPFYCESTTIPSRNMFLTLMVAGLAVIANWFSLYERLVAGHALRSSLFYALTFFCVLNFLMPVVFGMRNVWSLLLSGGIAAVMVAFFVYPNSDFLKNTKSSLAFFAGIALFITLLWAGRSFIPPAPLRVTAATACLGIDDHSPVDPVTAATIDRGSDVYFYTSIFAPRGLEETIHHLWRRNGRKLFAVRLSEIKGGRKDGFRTWSRHRLTAGAGRYTVEVWTQGGQILGAGSFTVTGPAARHGETDKDMAPAHKPIEQAPQAAHDTAAATTGRTSWKQSTDDAASESTPPSP
jgi:hypothetical protein